MKNKKSAVALALPLFFAASPIASCEPGSTQGGDTLTIILEPRRYFDPVDELSAFPGRTVEIRIYRETDSVWFDGIWWRIDAEFWDWLHDSFPFTKIKIHRKPKDQPNETDETETAQAPLPVGQRSGAAPDPGNDMPEEVDHNSRP